MTGATATRIREPRRRLAGLAAGWLALPPLAQADGPALNAQTLGFTESVLNYCGPIEPALALKLRAEARNSDEYRKAYDSVSELVARVDQHDARRICSASPP